MTIEDRLVKEAHVLGHPVRFRIVKLLAEKPQHIAGISKAMEEERRLVHQHLDILEKYGFVSSEYEISEAIKSEGKVIRIYQATDKVEAVLCELMEKL